jgi:hypothetical protein
MQRKQSENKIFSQIENVRKKNNKNWMDLLRLSYQNDPKNTLKILNNILKKDSQLVKLAKQLNKKK